MDNRPIGVFDSGLGGLTVLKEIKRLIPTESVVYFGDSGRAPYGTKSKDTIVKYTFQDIRFLLNQDIKMIVIACNTASACSLQLVKDSFDIPVIEVIEPGANTAVKETQNGKIGVVGTVATINSGVYERAINKLNSKIEVVQKACPLFVPVVEEGWWENDIACAIAEEYLGSLKNESIDTLVLGCTHYPLLYKTISKVMGEDVKLVSSALEVTKVVVELLDRMDIKRDESEIHSAEKVDIEKY